MPSAHSKQQAPSPGIVHRHSVGLWGPALSLPAPSSPLHCAVTPLHHLTKGKPHCESLDGPARGVLGKLSREPGERNKEAAEVRRGSEGNRKRCGESDAGGGRTVGKAWTPPPPYLCRRATCRRRWVACSSKVLGPHRSFTFRPGALRAWAPLDTAGWGDAHWVLTGRLRGSGAGWWHR